MKENKTTKHRDPVRVRSNGVVKKKKVKCLAQKLPGGHELKEALVTASGVTKTGVSPKNTKLKKNNKKNNLQRFSDDRISSLPLETKTLKMQNSGDVSQKPPGNAPKTSNSQRPIDISTINGASDKKSKIQKKKKDSSQTSAKGTTAGSIPGPKKAEDIGKKTKKFAKGGQPVTAKSNEQEEQRTIFVGNVSTKTTRKNLARFFSKYGKVEAVRLRCAPVPAPATSKRMAVITNTFHEKRTSLNAYVRFTEEAMAEAAVQANGAELDQKHLQVDHCQTPSEWNIKLAVFVGNLAFEAEEETLRSHFASCGEIVRTRIVRDKKLSCGKGFGFVNFASEDAVERALQLDGQVFMHRQLRVQRHTKKGKKGSKAASKTQGNKGLSCTKSKNTLSKRSIKKPSFSGKKMLETKKFKKLKAKAKLTKEDRKKKAIAHKLAGGKPKVKKTQ